MNSYIKQSQDRGNVWDEFSEVTEVVFDMQVNYIFKKSGQCILGWVTIEMAALGKKNKFFLNQEHLFYH